MDAAVASAKDGDLDLWIVAHTWSHMDRAAERRLDGRDGKNDRQTKHASELSRTANWETNQIKRHSRHFDYQRKILDKFIRNQNSDVFGHTPQQKTGAQSAMKLVIPISSCIK